MKQLQTYYVWQTNHNDANSMTFPPHSPYYMRHFQILNKINSFLKNIFEVLDIYLWWIAQFTYNCLFVFFFRFCCRLKEKRGTSWRNCLTWTADSGWEHNTSDTQNTFIIFLSVIAVMQVIFWAEDNFCFISDCLNSINSKLKKLINEQIIISYIPSNAVCSSDKSV